MEKTMQIKKKEFWGDDRFHDISFTFPQNENAILEANRMILALCSPVFDAMFFGDLAEQRELIPIVDIECDVFMSLLRYIYAEEFQVDGIDDIHLLYYAANKYEIVTLEKSLQSYVREHLFSFDLVAVKEFAEMFFLDEFQRLCELILQNKPLTDKKANWVRWKKGDPIPTGTYFDHFDKDKWPVGVCKFLGGFGPDARIAPGILFIKDMRGRNAVHGDCRENFDELEILCDGDLEWVYSCDTKYQPKSIICDACFYIGKKEYDGEVYIGRVEPFQYGLYAAAHHGDIEIVEDEYVQLIDKNSTVTKLKDRMIKNASRKPHNSMCVYDL